VRRITPSITGCEAALSPVVRDDHLFRYPILCL
jgi:hypothetical protein